MQNGALYQQKMWEPVISGKEFGSLPTPIASTKIEQKVPFKQGGTPLLAALLPTPTACWDSICYDNSPNKEKRNTKGLATEMIDLLPTPRASKAMTEKLETIKERGKNNCRLEETVAEMLPTPTAMDHLPQRGFESMVKQTQVHRKGRTKLANLREAVNPEAVKLFNDLQTTDGNHKKLNSTHIVKDTFLNPHFVEEMMRYTIGDCV